MAEDCRSEVSLSRASGPLPTPELRPSPTSNPQPLCLLSPARYFRYVIRQIIDWIGGLSPAGVYLAVALLAALENIFPPVPADTAAALGGFLAAQNPRLNVWLVWLVTVAANAGSAIGVYLLARKAGKGILASRLGRRILSPETVAAVQQRYERHHVWGIFVSRCLPVYRAVVPAFAGMMEIPASRAIPPMVAASAMFYGAVVWLAFKLGSNWDAVQGTVSRLGTGLLIAAGVVTVLVVWAVVRARRKRA
jgi:membrane protein DedA with SNARE-associated domain